MKNVALGIVIGATLSGSVASAFSSVKRMSMALEGELQRSQRKQHELGQMIQNSMGRLAPQGVAMLMMQYQRMGAAIDNVRARQEKLNHALAAHQRAKQHRQELGASMRETAAQGAALAAPLIGSVKAFMEQEFAATNMKVAYMEAGGKVAKEFGDIKKQALELGDALPGTTADFMNLGRVLKEQGMSASVVAGGALKASAYMNVLLDTPQEFGGEFIAKLMEARGIADRDLMQAADLVQRARFGFGMKPTDMLDSMKYDAATANILGIKGLGNTEKLLAVQGMGAQVGLEGASFGTNFSMFMQRMAKGPKMLADAKKGMKAEARAIVEDLGITFEFFDKKGNFKGIDAMVKELEKLDQIKKSKYGQEGALLVADQLFGAEAGRPAMIIAEKGYDGYQKNIQIMREQADLQTRIAEKSATLQNAWESLTGTATNFAASIGEIFGPELRQGFTAMNEFIGGPMSKWVQANKENILLGVKIVGGFLAMKLAIGGARLALSMFVGGPFRALRTGWAMFGAARGLFALMQLGGIGRAAMALRMLGVGAEAAAKWGPRLGQFWRLLATGAAIASRAFFRFGIALFTTPIGWITLGIAAIAAGAYLIYKNWDKIGPWFTKAWNTVKSAFQTAWAWFKGLPDQFMQLGKDILNGIIAGITSRVDAVVTAIGSVASKLKAKFTGMLGIQSPSRVFASYGLNIGEGAALGILRGVPGVQRAVSKLSAITASGALATAAHAVGLPAPGAGGGQLVIHFSPQITIQAGAGAQQTAQMTVAEMERMLKRVLAEQQRRTIG